MLLNQVEEVPGKPKSFEFINQSLIESIRGKQCSSSRGRFFHALPPPSVKSESRDSDNCLHSLSPYNMSIQLQDGLSGQSVDCVLEDLLVRFLVNAPDEDLSSIERIFFQVEEAQWFYLDFVRQLNPLLPVMKMKSFAPALLSKCPLIWRWGDPKDAISKFGKYKSTIPVRGIALMNKDLTKVVLVQAMDSGSF